MLGTGSLELLFCLIAIPLTTSAGNAVVIVIVITATSGRIRDGEQKRIFEVLLDSSLFKEEDNGLEEGNLNLFIPLARRSLLRGSATIVISSNIH